MNFDFYLPTRLVTGRGCVRQNAGLLRELGDRCLIVTSGSAAKKSGALDDVTAALDSAGVAHILYDRIEPNPTLAGSKEAGELAKEFGARFIIGIGGGSPLDAAKAAAVFAANDIGLLEVYDYAWPNPALPIVLVGTTAGTGSEVGPFAVMTTPEGKKKSFGCGQTFARLAFGDAGYTDTLPLPFTVSTALDALSHALEGYFSTAANEISDLFAIRAVQVLMPELEALRGVNGAADISRDARDRLYHASILAGFTLTRCGTCYCHALGYFLTEEHGTPHGFACAAFLSDFLRRAGRRMPGKAARLYREAACGETQLCGLIDGLVDYPHITLEPEKIAAIVDALSKTKNFAKTAPDGYTIEEAAVLMNRLFG